MTDKTDSRLNTDAASRAFEESKYYFTGESPVRRVEDWRVWIDAWNAALSASQPKALPNLAVWYGSMPESNGKTNWTAILHAGEIWKGITIDRSEYPDRVRYEADRMRWMIGELEQQPSILDYDADKHSGYVSPVSQPKALTDEKIDAAILEWFSYERNQDDFRARMRAAIIAATEAK